MAPEISDGGGRGALIFVEGGGSSGGRGIAEIGADDAVVLEDDIAFGAGNFDAARIAGMGGSGDMENAKGAAGEFEDGSSRVFGFDFVKKGAGASFHSNDITEEPEKQVDSVDALIDQGATAIERECPAPARIGVVLRRAIPLHTGVDDERPAEKALIEPVFELANVGLHAVLKNDAELDIGFFCGVDEGVGARGADFDRLFREDVKAMAGGGDALLSVEAGWASDDDEIHGAMV